MKKPLIKWASLAAVAAVAGMLFVFHQWENRRRLSFTPEGMGIRKVLYTEEESWGFGPGGNETGVIVYELPEAAAQEVSKHGLSYLKNLPAGQYDEWRSTPAPFDFNGRDAFEISLDPKVEKMISEALSRPGSFVGNGRSGHAIVIPASHTLVYAYSR